MNGPEKKITRCVQNAGTVEVYGSFAAEGPERERLLFAKAGTLKTFGDSCSGRRNGALERRGERAARPCQS